MKHQPSTIMVSNSASSVFSVGYLVNLSDGFAQVVDQAAPREVLRSSYSIPLSEADVGRQVVLRYNRGQPGNPDIVGKGPDSSQQGAAPGLLSGACPWEIAPSGELTLRCGKASITLTPSGKIILRGTYISTRSSGVVRIKGGSVQIN